MTTALLFALFASVVVAAPNDVDSLCINTATSSCATDACSVAFRTAAGQVATGSCTTTAIRNELVNAQQALGSLSKFNSTTVNTLCDSLCFDTLISTFERANTTTNGVDCSEFFARAFFGDDDTDTDTDGDDDVKLTMLSARNLFKGICAVDGNTNCFQSVSTLLNGLNDQSPSCDNLTDMGCCAGSFAHCVGSVFFDDDDINVCDLQLLCPTFNVTTDSCDASNGCGSCPVVPNTPASDAVKISITTTFNGLTCTNVNSAILLAAFKLSNAIAMRRTYGLSSSTVVETTPSNCGTKNTPLEATVDIFVSPAEVSTVTASLADTTKQAAFAAQLNAALTEAKNADPRLSFPTVTSTTNTAPVAAATPSASAAPSTVPSPVPSTAPSASSSTSGVSGHAISAAIALFSAILATLA